MSLALVSVANFGQTFICHQPALPHGIKVTWTSVSFSLVIEELVLSEWTDIGQRVTTSKFSSLNAIGAAVLSL